MSIEGPVLNSQEEQCITWSSFIQPASRMRPSLGFRCRLSGLHTGNLSLFW